MIRIRQLKVLVEEKDKLIEKVSKRLKINKDEIIKFSIVKESIDSRYKPKIFYVYELDVLVKDENIIKRINDNDVFLSNDESYNYVPCGNLLLNSNPVIVGSGPAGLFCAYMLSENGYNPIIIERGEKVEDRVKTVDNFLKKGILNEESNVQFGEGGAGCFSDGKLNTMVKDKLYRGKKVFEIFTECGAPADILYKQKPHIGTDLLRNVIKNMRNKIISNGGKFLFNTKLTDIVVENNKIKGVIVNNDDFISTDVLVIAIGHSARDTFYMLNNYLKMESKPFAIGLRVQHKQELINKNQYGNNYNNIDVASYKLTHTCKNKRGVYTFCMCPGGYVINSSSNKNMLCVNGMSEHKRNSENANSAVIVTVNKDDFGQNLFDGLKFQEKLEKKAYELGCGKIPVQLYLDFKNNKISNQFGSINPVFKGEYKFANLRELFSLDITNSFIEGMENFNKKISGFSDDDVILAGVESRTSSPIRILRDEYLESNVLGIYPCGEGAGYAGGITSSSIDGIKVSEMIMSKYKNNE